MGKKNKFKPKSESNDSKSGLVLKRKSNDLSNSDIDSNDSNGFDDEIDYFHSSRDKELLNKSALSKGLDSDEDEDNESNEEIMPFDDDSSHSEDNNNRFAIELKKDEMASDLEDSEEEQPDSSAWGHRKNVFYNTDYVDKDFRKSKQTEEDLAEYEEEEALAIQKRLLQSISESDVAIELLVGDIEPNTSNNDIGSDVLDEDEERLQTNLSNLTKRQKLEILRKESPELESLINDFETYLKEIKDRLLPVMQTIKDKKVFNLIGTKYIETRFHIIINYCLNICFYLSLKTKRIPVKEHPVIKQIVSFKKLLVELNRISTNNGSIDRDIDLVLEKLKSGHEINFMRKRTKKSKTVRNDKNVKKVKFADDFDIKQLPALGGQGLEESDATAKRGITYEIAKNKGLTPKRKKELKNPRVKHRMKFRKANIRRKGAVREPRKELHRYGGEISGIKSATVKSIKFK